MTGVNNLNFGLLGYGNIGRRHAGLIPEFGRLKAVCDVDTGKLSSLNEQDGLNLYSNYAEMLEAETGLDMMVVCTPNGLHAGHSIMALQRGCHVICEKPMALSKADCLAMKQAAMENRRQLFIVKQNRFNPPVVLLKNLLDSGKLGRIFTVQVNCLWHRDDQYYANPWRGTLALDGGTLFTQFSHFVDLLAWLFGDVKEVHGFAENFSHGKRIEFEDCGMAVLKFESGLLAGIHYSINAYRKNMEGSLTVVGEKGCLKIGGAYLNRMDYLEVEGMDEWTLEGGNPSNDYGSYQGSMNNHREFYLDALGQLGKANYRNNNLDDSIRTVEIIERIYACGRL